MVRTYKGDGVASGLLGADALNLTVRSLLADSTLHILARARPTEVTTGAVQVALKCRADVNRLDCRGLPALTYAQATQPDSAVVRLLIANAADTRALIMASDVVDIFSDNTSEGVRAMLAVAARDDLAKFYQHALKAARRCQTLRMMELSKSVLHLPKFRSGAIQQLEEILDESADELKVDVCVMLLAEKQYHARTFATIADLGEDALPAAPELASRLEDTDHVVRWKCFKALDNFCLGKAVVPELIDMLEHEDWHTRCLAAEKLGDLHEKPSSAVPHLIKLLGDRNHDVRCSAARALGCMKSSASSAVPSLTVCLKDPCVDVRTVAEQAVLKIQSVGPQRRRRSISEHALTRKTGHVSHTRRFS